MEEATIKIDLQGIERNGTLGNEPNGLMDDLVNFRHEAGALRPVPQSEQETGFSSIDVSKYVSMFVHTNSGYKNYLAVRGIGGERYALFLIAQRGASGDIVRVAETRIIECDRRIEFNQVGNLVVICGDNTFAYLLFELSTGAYREVNGDFNGLPTDTLLKPDLDIKFRVTPNIDSNGDLDVLMFCGGVLREKNDLGIPSVDKIDDFSTEMASASMLRALKKERELGRLKGFFRLIYAYELFDGNHILHSQPILLGQANDIVSRAVGTVGGVNFKNHYMTNDVVYGSFSLCRTAIFKGKVSEQMWIKHEDNGDGNFYFRPKVRDDIRICTPSTGGYERNMGKRYLPNLVSMYGMSFGVPSLNTISVSNKLQYRIDSDISNNYKDIIKGLSVFITKETYGFYENKNAVKKKGVDMAYGSQSISNVYNIQLQPKADAEIIKDIERNDLYYKVCSIEFDKLSKGDWIDIDLSKDGILANLEAQERLRVDNGSRDSHTPKTTFTYNGKLHIANYGDKPFCGFPLGYFFAHNSDGQFPSQRHEIWQNSVGNRTRERWIREYQPMVCIETDIDGELGTSKVVRYESVPYRQQSIQKDGLITLPDLPLPTQGSSILSDLGGVIVGRTNVATGKTIYCLNPILSYPDSRAKKMKITVQDVRIEAGEERIYRAVVDVDLKGSRYGNYAYYIAPDLKPIDIFPRHIYESPYILPKAEVREQRQTNMLRVSDVNNPMYFPPSNMYRVGNGDIIRLASNSISVGSGQVGAAPLIVFCTDGIWALMVDSSGELTYSNARPISRDVATSPDNVKSIDGGIVFATERGLMLLQGSQVIEVGEKVEGRITQNFSSLNEEKLLYAYNLFNNEKSVMLLNKVSDITKFERYIDGAQIGYNYNRKELVVANPSKSYHYVLSIDGKWYKRSGEIKYFIEDYPDTYININHKILRLNSDTGSDTETGFVTRPIKFGRQAFNRITRAVLRGRFNVSNYNYINDINCNEIDMSEKPDCVIELTDPLIRKIRLNSASNNNITEIRNLSPQPELVNRRIDMTAEGCVRYSVYDRSIVANGAILFPKNKFDAMYGDAALSDIELSVRMEYVRTFPLPIIGKISRPTSVSISMSGQNLESVWYKTADGGMWLGADGSVYESSSGTILDYWHWSVSGDNICQITDASGGTRLLSVIEYKAFELKDYIVNFFVGKEGADSVAIYSKGIELVVSRVLLETSKYYTFRIHPRHDLTVSDNNNPTGLVVDMIEPIEMINKATGEGTMPIVRSLSILDTLSKEVLTPLRTYRIMWQGATASIPYSEFLTSLHNGEYEDEYVEADYEFNLSPGRAYRLVDLDGNRYDFYYWGSPTIKYSELMSNIRYGIYERYDANKTVPDKVYVSTGENIRLTYNNESALDFVYTGKTGVIQGSTLLDEARSVNALPIQFIDDDYILNLRNGSKIELRYNGDIFKFLFKEDNVALDETIEMSAFRILNYVRNGVYRPLLSIDKETPICLQNGATRLIERSFNGEASRVHFFVYNGDSPIAYERLIENINAGIYTSLHPASKYAGIYVYGSYDGRRWSLLGRNEKTGTFTDLGCVVERTDCKYFKVLFFGNLTNDSSIDYLELSGRETIYKNKIR